SPSSPTGPPAPPKARTTMSPVCNPRIRPRRGPGPCCAKRQPWPYPARWRDGRRKALAAATRAGRRSSTGIAVRRSDRMWSTGVVKPLHDTGKRRDARGDGLIVEVEARVVQAAALHAEAEPEVGARALLQEVREVFAPHAGRLVE